MSSKLTPAHTGIDGRSTGAQDLIARTVRRGQAITQGLFLFL
ncbi:hypothetical protein [Luteococcus sp.]|nr:hypothetical protein [Luteococcus sp.]